MLTKTKCWFESSNLIVPKLKGQYILKKDLSYEYRDKSQCEFVKGMVCELYSYNSEKGLELKIDLRTMPNWWNEDILEDVQDNPHQFIFFHPMNAKLEGGIGGKVFKQYKVSQFYDYFEELDKDMTMDDVLNVRQAMDNLHSGVRALRTAIDDMDGDCNSLIVDDYPFPHSYDEWVIGFYDWYNSVDENINTYRHAIKSLGGKDE